MTPSAEIATAITVPLVILGLLWIEPVTDLVAMWIDREQRRRDLLAGVEVKGGCDDASQD